MPAAIRRFGTLIDRNHGLMQQVLVGLTRPPAQAQILYRAYFSSRLSSGRQSCYRLSRSSRRHQRGCGFGLFDLSNVAPTCLNAASRAFRRFFPSFFSDCFRGSAFVYRADQPARCMPNSIDRIIFMNNGALTLNASPTRSSTQSFVSRAARGCHRFQPQQLQPIDVLRRFRRPSRLPWPAIPWPAHATAASAGWAKHVQQRCCLLARRRRARSHFGTDS